MIVLALLATVAIESRDVVLQHRVPTRLVTILERALGPDGPLLPTKAGANADDQKRTIHLRSEPDLLDRIAAKLALFDQPRTRITVKAAIVSRMDKMRNDYVLDLENGSLWQMTESETGLTVRLWPLLQADGTMKLFASYTSRAGMWRSVSTLKPKQMVFLRQGGVAIAKPSLREFNGVPLNWMKVPEVTGDARKWYVTEGPVPELIEDQTASVEKFAEPVFVLSFEPMANPKGQ